MQLLAVVLNSVLADKLKSCKQGAAETRSNTVLSQFKKSVFRKSRCVKLLWIQSYVVETDRVIARSNRSQHCLTRVAMGCKTIDCL